MNNNHLIIGYGNWAKKIIVFLKKKKFFSKIYIKTRNNYFQLGKNRKLTKKESIKMQQNVGSIHICTPLNSHFYYLRKFIKCKKIIIEKPFLKNTNELKKIQDSFSSKNLLLVNYTYLFNPILNKLNDDIKSKTNKKIIIYFSKKNSFFEKKYDCINDWLDHPLSIILYLFNSFSNFKIVEKKFFKKNGFYEKIVINYFYKNTVIQIKINTLNENRKGIFVIKNLNKKIYNLNNNSIFFGKKKNFFIKQN